MTTMWERLIGVSTLGSGTAYDHINDVYENGGYVDYNYGGEFEVTLESGFNVVLEDTDITVIVDSSEYVTILEDDE